MCWWFGWRFVDFDAVAPKKLFISLQLGAQALIGRRLSLAFLCRLRVDIDTIEGAFDAVTASVCTIALNLALLTSSACEGS